MYEDITYEIAWKHKFDDQWAASAGFKVYAGDWQQPVNRNDWIYTPSAGLTYNYDKHLSAELATPMIGWKTGFPPARRVPPMPMGASSRATSFRSR